MSQPSSYMSDTEGERRAEELCREVSAYHPPSLWVLDEIRSILREHGDGEVLRDFCNTLQGKLALMPRESWPTKAPELNDDIAF